MGTDILTDEQFEEIKAKNPGKRFARVVVAPGEMILMNPSRQQHRMFRVQALDERTQAVAFDNLLVSTCAHPPQATLTQWLEDYPGITTNKRVVQALNELSGMSDPDEGKS